MGIDAIPLRTQPDRRLVRLVREGYESAFEEIVRRYRRPLDRFAASIVGGRSEDVTQDSFHKALVALRRDDAEIDLRPWLYRIVRNTALNDLRDRPPAAAQLAEELRAGGRSAAAVAEERAEVAALTAKLRALPEKQRAALVMRELEGMSHEEIATALGVSGGAARQAIARARTAVRAGLGAFVPLPLLRALASGGDGVGEAATGAGGAGGAGGAIGGAAGSGAGTVVGTAGGSAGGAFGGVGASVGAGGLGGALKVGLATVVVAGGIGGGVAIEHGGGHHHHQADTPQAVTPAPGGPREDGVRSSPSPSPALAEVGRADSGGHGGHDFSVDEHSRGDDGARHGRGHDEGRDHGLDDDGVQAALAAVPVADDPASTNHENGGHGPGASNGSPGPARHDGSDDDSGTGHGGSHQDGDNSSGEDHSGGDGSGRHGSDGGSGRGGGSPGDDHSGRGSSGSGGGSGDLAETTVEAPPAEPPPPPSESSSGGPGPSSSSSSSSSGSSGGPSPTLETEVTTEDGSHSDGGSDSGSSGGPEISP